MSKNGIVFDQLYTDSLIRSIPSDISLTPKIDLSDAVAIRELLVAILIYGHVHLLRPIWYDDCDSMELHVLENEGLISWIPQKYTTSAMQLLSMYYEMKEREVYGQLQPEQFDTILGRVIEENSEIRREEENELRSIYLEAEFDKQYALDRLTYLRPLLQSHLNHFLLGNIDDLSAYLSSFPACISSNMVLGVFGHPDENVHEFTNYKLQRIRDLLREIISDPVDVLNSGKFDGELNLELLKDENIHDCNVCELLRETACFYLASISCSTIDYYSSKNNIPVITSSISPQCKYPNLQSNDEYILVQAQFDDLRYPVIDTIDDLLRLKDDRRINAYRNVITDYSSRLRSEMEEGRLEVLNDFKHDLALASDELRTLTDRNFIGKHRSLFFSIPVAIMDVILQTPFSLIFTAASLCTKYVESTKKNELDWLMLGDPFSS